MHVIVDGVVYARRLHRGINTYFKQALPRIALPLARAPQGHPRGSPVRLLPGDAIPIPHRTRLSWRVVEKVAQLIDSLRLRIWGLWAKTKAQAVFHSTYLTSLPAFASLVATLMT
jgi:hypothetical protein